ncbi:hypothetical protein FPY71_07065 [Aureimonas fodinaquatilis]|uniref:Uncharacterized protein n=1 Tax=Aureimonas fodinaquatilis TaxID=2565783 RepID=A0A5B0DYK7_9HYPH|nr:hypothetical protein [Aureimonas fodinaquatilis]KAA0970279.1 hypothetical protein FPY71_07065 [Aureimonas fodinaquatilis]
MKLAIILTGIVLASPALAETPSKPVEQPKQTLVQKWFSTNQQSQHQAQAQTQGQTQQQNATANATGGNAAASANNGGVNVTSKNVTVVAPSISGNGDTNAVSLGTPFGAVGFALPTAGYKSGQVVRNIISIGNDRALLYTQCSIREAHATLMLKGVRCDLARAGRYQELAAYEASLKPVAVKKAPAKKKVRKAKAKPACGCK